MKILFVIMFSLTFTSILADTNSTKHLRLVGVVLPVSQVKIIQDQNIKIETKSNSNRSYENQKVYLTDMNKNLINVKSNFSEDENGKIKQTVLLNLANEKALEGKDLYFNIVSN